MKLGMNVAEKTEYVILSVLGIKRSVLFGN